MLPFVIHISASTLEKIEHLTHPLENNGIVVKSAIK